MTDENTTNSETLETEEEETEEQEENQAPPSVSESTREAFNQLKEEKEVEANAELQGDKGEKAEKPAVDKKISKAAATLAAAKKGKKRQVIEFQKPDAPSAELTADPEHSEEPEEVIDPPYPWDVQTKEWFNGQPAKVKKEYLKTFNGFQAQFTKQNQELERQKSRYTEANQLLDEVATEWGADNPHISVAAGIREIAATRRNLVNKPLETIAELCAKRNITPQQLHDYMNGSGAQPAAQQNNNTAPTKPWTKEEIRQMLLETTQEEQTKAAIERDRNEIFQAGNEKDAQGRYLYAELQNPEFLRSPRVQALTSHLKETQPALSWAEVYKQAVQQTRFLDGKTGSPSLNGPRLPSQQEIQKIKQASVSVRSRGSTNTSTNGAAKPGESIVESTRRTYQQLMSSH